MLIAIELADLSALFHAEEVLTGARSRLLIQVEVSHLVGVAREFGQFGLSHTPVETCCPLNGLLCQHVVLECHFDTGILGGTHIHQDGVVDKRRLRCRVVIEQILRTAVVKFHATAQSAVQGHEIHTYIEGRRLLPSQIGIGIQRRGITVDPLVVDQVGATGAIGGDTLIGIEVRTPCNTIADAWLQALEALLQTLGKRGAGDFPSQRCRREVTPLLVGTELGATLAAHRDRGVDHIVVVIIDPSEEADQC